MNQEGLRQFIENVWQKSIIDRLQAYVRIPNKSPAFDPDWERHGHMEAAIRLMAEWCEAQPVAGMRVGVGGLLCGQLDKHPAFTGLSEGLGPWEPVMREGRLYGRGGADDGYAV